MDGFNRFNPEGSVLRLHQMKMLRILEFVDRVCRKHGIRYWLSSGTLLGAVRHAGFIPWDDDLDVFLPRKDYERLYEIWDQVADTSHYVLVRTDEKVNYHHAAMNLVDVRTTYVNRHSVNEDIYHGIYIDVIPFEGCPNSKVERALQIYHSIMFSVFNVQRLPDNQGSLLRLPTKILLSLVRSSQSRYKIWKKNQDKMTQYDFFTAKYVKETVSSFKGLFRLYDRDIFNTVDAVFEGYMVKIPAGYDYYMKCIYGDYMSLPKDISIDMSSRYEVVKFIDLNEPYTKYRGIYYLVDVNE